MKSSAILLVCLWFLQNAFSQYPNRGTVGLVETNLGTNYNNVAIGGVNYNSLGAIGVPDVAAIAQLPVTGPYGGTGTGEMSVAGEVTASGQTVVTGQVPVIGSVSFSGTVPAGGVVSIAGNCGCAGRIY